MNQSALARELGTRPHVVNRWINQGVIPEGRHLLMMPELLGVSGHWLLTGKGPPKPEAGQPEAAAFWDIAQIVHRIVGQQ